MIKLIDILSEIKLVRSSKHWDNRKNKLFINKIQIGDTIELWDYRNNKLKPIISGKVFEYSGVNSENEWIAAKSKSNNMLTGLNQSHLDYYNSLFDIQEIKLFNKITPEIVWEEELKLRHIADDDYISFNEWINFKANFAEYILEKEGMNIGFSLHTKLRENGEKIFGMKDWSKNTLREYYLKLINYKKNI